MMYKLSRRSSNAGFTLIEVLVVVIIIAVLAAIAAPGWVQFLNSRRAGTANDQILQALRLTQAEASRTGRYMAMTVTTATTGQLTVIARRPWAFTSNTWTLAQGESEILGRGNIPNNALGVTIAPTARVQSGQATVTFSPNGSIVTEFPDGTQATDVETSGDALLVVGVSVPPGTTSNAKRCLIVQTLLGSIRKESGSACP